MLAQYTLDGVSESLSLITLTEKYKYLSKAQELNNQIYLLIIWCPMLSELRVDLDSMVHQIHQIKSLRECSSPTVKVPVMAQVVR